MFQSTANLMVQQKIWKFFPRWLSFFFDFFFCFFFAHADLLKKQNKILHRVSERRAKRGVSGECVKSGIILKIIFLALSLPKTSRRDTLTQQKISSTTVSAEGCPSYEDTGFLEFSVGPARARARGKWKNGLFLLRTTLSAFYGFLQK